jgi:hypothetical protein
VAGRSLIRLAVICARARLARSHRQQRRGRRCSRKLAQRRRQLAQLVSGVSIKA